MVVVDLSPNGKTATFEALVQVLDYVEEEQVTISETEPNEEEASSDEETTVEPVDE